MKAKIIGCGLVGITAAIILKERGYEVEIFDSRSHIGGNCYDENINDITVHKYGPHIFHTNDEQVWKFLNRYTSFNNYIHRSRANTSKGLISIPYNYYTRDQIGEDLSTQQIQTLIFKDYSERHWGIPWKDLPKSISNRVPNKRNNYDDRYFTDRYQGIPEYGYTNMFNNMLDGFKIHLNIPYNYYKNILDNNNYDILIYTGKPDDYFDYCYGFLQYRSLRFEHSVVNKSDIFSWDKGAIINECNSLPYNRTSDNSIFLNQKNSNNTTIYTKDYPEEHNKYNDPIYPKNFGDNPKIYTKYLKLSKLQNKTIFLGRLATYKYLDMWMAIKQVFTKLNYSI